MWCRIFKDLVTGVNTQGHIDGTDLPKSLTDENWFVVDSNIKSWFYHTCDTIILQIITRDKCIAKDLWDELDRFFLY